MNGGHAALCPPYSCAAYHRHEDRCGEFAPAQQQQARGQSAAAADPVAHRGGIGLQHQFGGFRLGIGAAAPVDRARGMETEHRTAGDADAVVRHDAQHQRAGRQAGPVDHHAFAGLAHLVEQIEERADLSAGARRMRTSARASMRAKATRRDGEQQSADDAPDAHRADSSRSKVIAYQGHPFRRSPRSVGRPMPAASKPPSTAKICPVM